MLKMKKACEKCSVRLSQDSHAYICSYECTFCQDCTESMQHTCPNCQGQLVSRPTRLKQPAAVAATQIKKGISGIFSNET